MAQRGFGTLFRSLFTGNSRDRQQQRQQPQRQQPQPSQPNRRPLSTPVPSSSHNHQQRDPPSRPNTSRPRRPTLSQTPHQPPATVPTRQDDSQQNEDIVRSNQRVPAAMRRIGLHNEARVPNDTTNYNLRSKCRSPRSKHLPDPDRTNEPSPFNSHQPQQPVYLADVEMVDTTPPRATENVNESERKSPEKEKIAVDTAVDNKSNSERLPSKEESDKITPANITPVEPPRAEIQPMREKLYRLRPVPSAGTTSGIAARTNLISDRQVAVAGYSTLRRLCEQLGLPSFGTDEELRARVMKRLKERTVVNEQTQELDEMGNPKATPPELKLPSNSASDRDKQSPQSKQLSDGDAEPNQDDKERQGTGAKELTTCTVNQPDEEHPGAPGGVTAKSNKPPEAMSQVLNATSGDRQVQETFAEMLARPTVSCSGIREPKAPMSPMPMNPDANHFRLRNASRAKINTMDASVPLPADSVDARGEITEQVRLENLFRDLSQGRVLNPKEYEACVKALKDRMGTNAGEGASKSNQPKIPKSGARPVNQHREGEGPYDMIIASSMRPPQVPPARSETPAAMSTSGLPFKLEVTGTGNGTVRDMAVLQQNLANKLDDKIQITAKGGGNRNNDLPLPTGTTQVDETSSSKGQQGFKYLSKSNKHVANVQQNPLSSRESQHGVRNFVLGSQSEIKQFETAKGQSHYVNRNPKPMDPHSAAVQQELPNLIEKPFPRKFQGAIGGPSSHNTVPQIEMRTENERPTNLRTWNAVKDADHQNDIGVTPLQARAEERNDPIAAGKSYSREMRSVHDKDTSLPNPSDIIQRFNNYGESDDHLEIQDQNSSSRWDKIRPGMGSRLPDRPVQSAVPPRKAISKVRGSPRQRPIQDKCKQLESFRKYGRRSSFRAKRPASIAGDTLKVDLRNAAFKSQKRGSLPAGSFTPSMPSSTLRILSNLKRVREENKTHGDRKRQSSPLPLPQSASKRARREGTFTDNETIKIGPNQQQSGDRTPRSSPFNVLSEKSTGRKGNINYKRVHGVGKRRSASMKLSQSAKKSFLADAEKLAREQEHKKEEQESPKPKYVLEKVPSVSLKTEKASPSDVAGSASHSVKRIAPEISSPSRRKEKRTFGDTKPATFNVSQRDSSPLSNFAGTSTGFPVLKQAPSQTGNVKETKEEKQDLSKSKLSTPAMVTTKIDEASPSNNSVAFPAAPSEKLYKSNPPMVFGKPSQSAEKPTFGIPSTPVFAEQTPKTTSVGTSLGQVRENVKPSSTGTDVFANVNVSEPESSLPLTFAENDKEEKKDKPVIFSEQTPKPDDEKTNLFAFTPVAGIAAAETSTAENNKVSPITAAPTGLFKLPSTTAFGASASSGPATSETPFPLFSTGPAGFSTTVKNENPSAEENKEGKSTQGGFMFGAAGVSNKSSSDILPFGQSAASKPSTSPKPFHFPVLGSNKDSTQLLVADTTKPENETNTQSAPADSTVNPREEKAGNDTDKTIGKPFGKTAEIVSGAATQNTTAEIISNPSGFIFDQKPNSDKPSNEKVEPSASNAPAAKEKIGTDLFKVSAKPVTLFGKNDTEEPEKQQDDASKPTFHFGQSTGGDMNASSTAAIIPTTKTIEPKPSGSSILFGTTAATTGIGSSIFGDAVTPKPESTAAPFSFGKTMASESNTSTPFMFGSSAAGPFGKATFPSTFSSAAESGMFVFGSNPTDTKTDKPVTFPLAQNASSQANTFGTPFSSSAPVFGAAQSSNASSTPATTTNLFGQADQSTKPDPFGISNTKPTTTTPFGQPFGSGVGAPTFGTAASGAGFGTNIVQNASFNTQHPFSSAGNNVTTGGTLAFGGTTNAPNFNSTNPSNPFNTPQQQQQSGPAFGFGTNDATTSGFGNNTANAFGSNVLPTTQSGPSAFGAGAFGNATQSGAFAVGIISTPQQIQQRRKVRGRRVGNKR